MDVVVFWHLLQTQSTEGLVLPGAGPGNPDIVILTWFHEVAGEEMKSSVSCCFSNSSGVFLLR